ncbi:MAG TPA: CCA tRNA nucleotidyltransferase, partial [Candidatus Hydrogenedentes bacterium]|nr:CCA tRNA nucleotidyltransferase [Candidatus Hydrogenedentota bacterium]
MDPLELAAREICARLRDRGFRALFAGGCVRDRLLGVPPKDYDIATDAHVLDVLKLFPKTIEVGKAFGVLVVVRPEGRFEVATFRQDGPYLDGRHPDYVAFTSEEEDAQRRDFTVNALFFDPETEQIVDYVDGVRDLRAKIIRAVGNPAERFDEDHLRLLRAVRFAARLDYAIDPATFAAIRAKAALIRKTSPERIRDELLKILTEGAARRAFELMDATGLLEHALPEVARMKGVAQPEQFHPEGDVFVHTLLLLEHLENPTPTLAMGALLHDVGKPETQTFEDRIRFNLHDKVGARIAENICKRLRFPAAQIERIRWLVERHMRVTALPKMRESRRRRFVREEGFDELLEL